MMSERTSPHGCRFRHRTRLLAEQLQTLARGESVRMIETLAELLARGGIASAATDDVWHGRPLGLAEDGSDFTIGAENERRDREVEMCRRIARRALGGCLPDRTRGATAFHRAGEEPAWARGQIPVAEIGPFLFYRLPASGQRPLGPPIAELPDLRSCVLDRLWG